MEIQDRRWNWSLDEFIRVKSLLPPAPEDQQHHAVWARNYDMSKDQLAPERLLLTFVYQQSLSAWQYFQGGNFKGIFFTR